MGDDGGAGRDQTVKGENCRPSQHIWSFIQLAEKGQKCFVEVSHLSVKSELEGTRWETGRPSRGGCRAPVREEEGWARVWTCQ